MKRLFIILLAVTASLVVQAQPLNSIEEARAVKEAIKPSLASIRGINGLGISGCNPNTGERVNRGNFVYCVVVRAATAEAYYKATSIYPPGRPIQNVYVSVEYVGPISSQPRMGAGT